MQTRMVIWLTVICVGYGAFMHAAKARGQAGTQAEPTPPAMDSAVLVMPPSPAVPGQAAEPAMPRMPGVPAIPPIPAAPEVLKLASFEFGDNGSGFRGHRDEPAADCNDLRIRLHDEKPMIEPEERIITKSQAQVLRVHAMKNGGAQVQGWDKDTYSVTACKAAVGSDAKQLLSQIKLQVEGGEVSVSGPSRDEDEWTVYLLIRTPKAADLELSTRNGPAAIYAVDGKINVRAQNGPISVADCTGEADVAAVNGPISFSGNGGKLRLHTENGPISVALGGSNWDGGGLVADAVNGPVTLHVPSGFQSSFVVESSEHTPVTCQASICSETRRTWDDAHRRIEFGSGTPVIRLSTQNGPISVM
jgi:hypothetical protein